MSEDEIKYENSQDSGEEAGMDDCTAEYVFRVFQEMNAEGDLSAAVSRWTKFLSAGKTEWILSSAKNTQNLDPAIQVVDARMIHTGMGIHIQDIWLDIQNEYTVERGEYLNRFSGRMNNPFYGFEAEHPTLLVGPIPSGDDPLGEILKLADDRLFSFRWLDGTHFRALPCIDRSGSLLICDLKNMDRIDVEKTNAALSGTGGMIR